MFRRDQRVVKEGAALPRSVTRALKAMRACPERTLSVKVLAALGGVSPRTLQRQFRLLLGKPPLAALQDIRFECARRELLRASPSLNVTAIALRFGLAHLGRFSVEYSRRYGEKPSQTIKRKATFLAGQSPGPHLLGLGQDRPTIAVVPIETSERDKAIARGVAEELATALLRAGIAVTNRPEVARYHLRCTLRGDGRQVHLTCRLIEAATARHIWAHRHDGTSDDVFLFEEGVAATVAAAMQPGLRAAEIERARRKPDFDLTAHDLTLRALPHALALDVDGNGRALDLLGRAMDCDPDHTLAIALAAWCHAQRVVYQFTDALAQERAQALRLARRAIIIGGDSTVLAILGNALALAGDVETADIVTRKALALDGSSAWAWSRSGLIDVYKERAKSAIERLFIALDLAPDDPLALNSFMGLGLAQFNAGRYVEAVHWFQRAIAEHPSAVWAHLCLCPAYVCCGRKAEAHHSLANLQRLYPELTISRVTAGFSFLAQPLRDRLLSGLETVGLPP